MPAFEVYQLILIALSLGLGLVSLALWVARRSHAEEEAQEHASALSDMEHKVDETQTLLSSGSHEKAGEGGEETIKLLITGYGPFRGYPQQNPSTLTARHLANLVLHSPPSPAHAKGRRIEITFLPVSVNYSAVDEVIPPFHKEQRYDAYVHVGVASRAKDGLRIEQRGRKGEYNSPDSEGLYCPRDAEGRRTVPGWKGDKEEILSRLDTEGLLHWLKKDKGIQHIRLSDNAGLYLCEYIYATSLSASRPSERQSNRTPPVLFIHVPDLRPADLPPREDLSVYTELEVADILKDICWWVGTQA